MDKEKYELIDGILTTKGFREDRDAALDILELGVREGTLVDVAGVIARRYALQPQAIVEWFAEVLNRRVEETTQLIQTLTNLRVDNVGSQ